MRRARAPSQPVTRRLPPRLVRLVVGYGLRAADLVRSPLLIAIILSATGLGIVLPILKDAGETATPFGQGSSRRPR